jgi:23S rRNA (adenine2030-N6)-methyltransferase
MNYRHLYHAGSFTDVFKHFILTHLLLKLREKKNPFCVLDTHAGIGLYNLYSPEALKTLEYQKGVERLLKNALHDADFEPYIQVIKSVNEVEGTLKKYPGSPFITRYYLRQDDRLKLSELHPEDFKTLKKLFEKDSRVQVIFQDGYQSLKALLPPLERRGAILIDPPFEQIDEFSALIKALKEAQKRFSYGIYAIWYPIKNIKSVESFYKELKKILGFKEILRLELSLKQNFYEEGLRACGMAILNPPWKFEEKMKKPLERLIEYLETKGTVFISKI